MLWRRYRWIVITSVPAAALIGMLLALALYLGGNPDYREQGGWSAFASMAATGTVIGALTSVPAIIGAAAALALKDRRLRRTSGARAWIGALGAAAGALVGWTALTTINAILTTEGGAWFSVYLIFAVLASLISGAAAAALIWWTEIRALAAEAPKVRANGAAESAR
ncbi:hypothetical protein GCM10017608_30040 [Agromyces luteolus]|uniref:Uncharacterized protein n=1 Tax=Agromyces luteolus TaxID=88373 RepID=A0A7C9HQF3_9MICO|nr:hypothetical protein [Agromyces luteolus]MUN06849.1 hypothetical protein [Agromyces luteolus]GLK29068.1 hypothetical protein GCM10017608_30040 [Agromyces luteolus]